MPKKVIALGGGAGSVTATAGALTSNAVVLGAGTTDTKVVAGITTDGTKELDLGAVGVGSGILGLNGTTSGKATLTAPAVAGTATNPIVSTNSISVPTGAGITTAGTLILTGGNHTAQVINGSGVQLSLLLIGTTQTGQWSNTGFITKYGNIATVDNGVPSELGHLDLTAQSAAITATTIYTPTATGRFRISVYAKVTTAASVSSVLGGASGFTLTYTDGTDSVAQSVVMAMDTATGTVALTAAGNSTTTLLTGTTYIYAKTGVAIQLAVGYTSTNAVEMVFALRATCEAL